MKTIKFIIALVVVASAFGCSRVESSAPTANSGAIGGMRTVIIDNCEYLVVENGAVGFSNYSFAITHKGNCKNHSQ